MYKYSFHREVLKNIQFRRQVRHAFASYLRGRTGTPPYPPLPRGSPLEGAYVEFPFCLCATTHVCRLPVAHVAVDLD